MRGFASLKGVLLAVGLSLVVVACGDGSGPDNLIVPGQTDFTNTEPANGGGWGDRGGLEGDYQDGATGAPSTGNDASNGKEGAPSGRTGEVEEADIYKVDNNRLFYLNTYRGFLIYDLQNPKKPVQLSRLGVYGYPIEMYIQKNTVYALIRDALYLTQVGGKLEFKRHNVSQLVAIDISDIKNPKVIKTVDIKGELREGVSRKIEDTVYVVSYFNRYYYWGWYYNYKQQDQKEQAWVYSFNIADPKNIKLVDTLKVFEGGGYANSGQSGYERRYFSKVTISATSNALMVVENWRKYGYVKGSKYNCSTYTSQQEAVVSVVDVSDPSGKIKLHTKFETWGELGDQFKQTYIYDPKTKKGHYYGIFARREWNNQNCTGSSFIQNTLESWDITDGKNPKQLDALAFGKPNETVRGSVFDRDRKVSFAITARNIDPLYALSFKDPSKLTILSAIDGLSGDMSVFRFIDNNQFLIGIGRDNTDVCSGYEDPHVTGRATNVAVSVIDVRNLSNIQLVQRQCVLVKNASWVSSELTWNLDQAHKMIGMHSDGKVNVISVPVYYYKKRGEDDWYWYGYETAVGLMTWDTSKYDPAKHPWEQKVLQNYGTVIHPKGQVRRSIVFTHKGTKNQRMMLNLSDTHVTLVNIENLNKPEAEAEVEVAPYHAELYTFGNYMVEHVRSGGSGYYYYSSDNSASEFRVKAAAAQGTRLEDRPELARFTVGNVQKVMKWKDKLALFRRVKSTSTPSGSPYYYNYETEVLVYDLSNPLKPVKQGSVRLPIYYLPYYRYWCGPWGYDTAFWFGYYYNYGTAWATTDRGVSFLSHMYDYQTQKYERKMVFLDLVNGNKPSTSTVKLTDNNDYAFYNLVNNPLDSSTFYVTFRVKVGQMNMSGTTFYLYKYFGQRWDYRNGKWQEGPTISLPGRLMKVWKQGNETRFLTYDYTYRRQTDKNGNTQWIGAFRVNMLRERNYYGTPVAELMDFHHFDHFHLKDLVLDSQYNRLYFNARPNTYWDYWDKSQDWVKSSDHLMIFDISGNVMKETYAAPTATYNVQLMGTYQGNLFVNLPGDGLLVVDAAQAGKPIGKQFKRTLGYASHVEFNGNTAYIASGYFGIYELDLQGNAVIPPQP